MDNNATGNNFLARNKTWIIVVVVILLIGGWFVSKYNSLVTLNQNITAQWAQVENQFQRRFDLIPNLEASVKGAFSQEKQVFADIDAARTHYAGAQTTDEKVAAAPQVESAFSRLLVITENYPQLASLTTVKDLMVDLEGTENRIAEERRKYNTQVQTYNSYLIQFPSNLVAGMFGFKAHEYFNAPESAQTAPKVDLTQ